MPLDFRAAAVMLVQFAAAYGFYQLADKASRIRWRPGAIILSWPCYGMAFLFMSSIAALIIMNMTGQLHWD